MYLGLRAMANQLPNQLLTLLQIHAQDSLSMGCEVQCFATIGGYLYKPVECRWLCCQFMRQGVAEYSWRC